MINTKRKIVILGFDHQKFDRRITKDISHSPPKILISLIFTEAKFGKKILLIKI